METEITPATWNELCELLEEEKINQFYEEVQRKPQLLLLELATVPDTDELLFSDDEAKTLIDAIILGGIRSEKHFRSGY